MKIQSHLQPSTRKQLRNKLKNHPKLHNFIIFLHRIYCSITGFMHVVPDFYIIGVEKGGTSSLYRYLIQHPFVHPAVTKEINYFNKFYHRGNNWYRVGFPFKFHKFIVKKFTGKNFVTGEASVRYFDYPHTPQRIKKITPNAKFILLLRNPIERAFSEHAMTTRAGYESLSFEDAIKDEKERTENEYEKMLTNENYFHETYFRHAYLKRGIYLNSLEHWMKLYPREQFLILKSEDFFENPSIVYNQVLKFLNLPKWELDEYKIWRPANKKSKLDLNMQKKLIDYFKPHNEKLYKFLGTNFNWDHE